MQNSTALSHGYRQHAPACIAGDHLRQRPGVQTAMDKSGRQKAVNHKRRQRPPPYPSTAARHPRMGLASWPRAKNPIKVFMAVQVSPQPLKSKIDGILFATAVKTPGTMAKIIPLNNVTRLDLPPERVLAVVPDLEGVVIMGREEYFASSYADGGDVLWLMEQLRLKLMGVEWGHWR
jgi:hypothetical protein